MSLLDHLWDDTIAGPTPENGLGKLRKQSTFSFRPSSGKESYGANERSFADDAAAEGLRVTRSIMIVKPQGSQNGSPPVSPAGSTPPVSPFAGGKEAFRFRRRSSLDEKAIGVGSKNSSPPPYNV